MSVLNVVGAVSGAVYVLGLPGWALSYVFFRRGAVDVVERVALSFALSIAVVPLIVFYLNLLGVRISRMNVILEVAGITVVAAVTGWWLRRPKSKPAVPPAPLPVVEGKPAGKRSGPQKRAATRPRRPPRSIQF